MHIPTCLTRRDRRPEPADDGRIALELRIAVTGHRTLTNEVAVRKAIDDVLDLICNLLPATTRARCRLVAVSGLAEGADRLVADAVLARPGGGLEVILPVPKNEYIADFDPADSRQDFERLLARASCFTVIAAAPTRDDAYLRAGQATVDRADVTIAVWDGRHAAGKGGTGEIVGYARQRHRPLIWLPADGGAPVTENLAELTETGWPALLTANDLSRLQDFNTAPLRAAQRGVVVENLTKLLGDRDDPTLASGLTDLFGWIAPPLVRAEVLTRHFQLLYRRLSSTLFALGALAVCIVALQLVFFPHARLVVLGEISCLIVIIGALEWGRRRHVHERWIATRYLAERLRNALFLALAGADEQKSAIPLSPEPDPAAPWIQAAFCMVWARRPLQWDPRSVPVESLKHVLLGAWIEDQRSYFEKASRQQWRRHRISAMTVEGLFSLSVVIAIVHVALGGPENWLHHLISLLAISVPACAAALAANNTQREYLRNALRCRRMVGLLAVQNNQMLAASDHARVQDVAFAVDRTLRQERGDWFGIVSLHDLELPA